MRKEDFLTELFNVLEIESIKNLTEDTILRDLPEYTSLSVLSIIVLVDENFNKKITAVELKGITTVKSLINLIGLDNFEA